MRIRHFGLHNSYARAQRLPQAGALLGLEVDLPKAKPSEPAGMVDRGGGDLGIGEIDRCPHCGREVT